MGKAFPAYGRYRCFRLAAVYCRAMARFSRSSGVMK